MLKDDIWRFLPRQRAAQYEKFLTKYHARRRAEGWASASGAYYRDLPYVRHDDSQHFVWRIRQKSFRRLIERLGDHPQRILDVGAGNSWLANRLALCRHAVAALDVSADPFDGLGARQFYTTRFESYQAEFDAMPFGDAQFDLAIFSASLHYASALATTLREARRVIAAGGKIVVLDSPFYNDAESGMNAAREQISRLGLRDDGRMPGFLTLDSMSRAARQAGLKIKVWSSDEEWHKRLRRKFVQRKLKREPAHFPILALEN